MNFFDNVKQNINTQKTAEAQQKQNEAEELKKKRISSAKKQSLVNTLVLQRMPAGGQ